MVWYGMVSPYIDRDMTRTDYLPLTAKQPEIANHGLDIEVDGDITEQHNEEREADSDEEDDESPWPAIGIALNSLAFAIIGVVSKAMRNRLFSKLTMPNLKGILQQFNKLVLKGT